MLPIQITARGFEHSEAIEDSIYKKFKKIEQLCHRILSCRVVIDVPQKHKHQGKLYSVHIDLVVPGKELAVNHKYNEDVYIAIRDAFAALEHQLETYARKRRGEVKKRAKLKQERNQLLLKEENLH